MKALPINPLARIGDTGKGGGFLLAILAAVALMAALKRTQNQPANR
jgi:hypothetical protein